MAEAEALVRGVVTRVLGEEGAEGFTLSDFAAERPEYVQMVAVLRDDGQLWISEGDVPTFTRLAEDWAHSHGGSSAIFPCKAHKLRRAHHGI